MDRNRKPTRHPRVSFVNKADRRDPASYPTIHRDDGNARNGKERFQKWSWRDSRAKGNEP